jgi:tetratricopeptide (TPR) repeat protein
MKRIPALLLIVALAVAGGAQTPNAQSQYQQGHDALVRGDHDKAVDYLEKAVALSPQNARYHYQLGNAYGQSAASSGMFSAMSKAKKAKAEWERAIELDPNFVPARFSLLEFYSIAPSIAGGDKSAALAQAAEIRKRDPIEGHRAFARIHTAAKKPDLARKEYFDMVKEQPGNARAHYHYGVFLMLTDKNYKAAGDEFELAAKLDPTYMPAFFQIGHAAVLAGNNLERGEETLKKYFAYRPTEDEPPPARTLYWLGGIYEKQGKKAEARSTYAASLKLNPNQKDAKEAMKRVQ